MKLRAAPGSAAITAFMLGIGLFVFLAMPSVAFADNGGDHADGWGATAAAALAAAGGGGLAALLGRWFNPWQGGAEPPWKRLPDRKGPGRFDRMDRKRRGPPQDYLRQPPAPPPPPIEPPADGPPPEQSSAYDPGGISSRN